MHNLNYHADNVDSYLYAIKIFKREEVPKHFFIRITHFELRFYLAA